MALKVPSRTREVYASGQAIYLRRPDRKDLGPVLDEVMREDEVRDADVRQRLELDSQERIAAACVMVCARSNAKAGATPEIDLEDALAIAVEAAADEGVPLQECELVKTSRALCRQPFPKVTPEMMALYLKAQGKSEKSTSR